MVLGVRPVNAVAQKTPHRARAKTVLSRCLLGAAIAPGLPREWCNRSRWAFRPSLTGSYRHQIVQDSSRSLRCAVPRATGSSCLVVVPPRVSRQRPARYATA